MAIQFHHKQSPSKQFRGILLVIIIFFLASRQIATVFQTDCLDLPRSSSSSSSDAILPEEAPPLLLLFNPFTDIRFGTAQTFDEKIHRQYFSSHHCVGTGAHDDVNLHTDEASYLTRRPNYVNRSCKYKNIFYRPSDQTFHYLPSPIERRVYQETVSMTKSDVDVVSAKDLESGMQVCLANVFEPMPADKLKTYSFVPWNPEIMSEQDIASATFAVLESNKNLVFELFVPFQSFNIGHLIWDDIDELFSLLNLFGYNPKNNNNYDDIQPVPFFVELHRSSTKHYGGYDKLFRCSPWNHVRWENCVKMYRKLYPQLLGIQTDCSGDILRTGNWLLGQDMIGVWTNHTQENCSLQDNHNNNEPPEGAEYIILPETLAGAGRMGEFACQGDCAVGKGNHYWEFRNFMMYNLFGGAYSSTLLEKIPPKGYITFSLPIGSTRPDEVYMFATEIQLAKAKYGEACVKVVDMSTISMKEQARLTQDSAVYLTNHGGGSATTIFLHRGAGALVFWRGKKMDHGYFESTVHFRTTWVGVEERPFINRTMALIDQSWKGLL